jgi:hypothetical protein
MIRPDRDAGRLVTALSDSSYSILEAKMIYAGQPLSIDYEIVYDGDMYVIENFAAKEKGICLGKEAFWTEHADGRTVARLEAPGRVDEFRCGSCSIVSYEAERVELDVEAEETCILLFQDLYYPGWRAFVDGARQPILSSAMGTRAIELGKGSHRVVMEYRPGSLKLGLGLTVLGLISAIIYGTTAKKREQEGGIGPGL